MRLLWVLTKPPWPPRDGGRLVAAHSIAALCAAGHEVDVVAPVDDASLLDDASAAASDAAAAAPALGVQMRLHLVVSRRPGLLATVTKSFVRGVPLTVARHDRAALRARVAELLRERRPDVVHAEQLHALAACAHARAAGVPVVLRCQNVESDLWSAFASRLTGVGGALARREAARVAAHEAHEISAAAAAIALTTSDATRLNALARGRARVVHVRAALPDDLPPGPPLDGPGPALAVLGSPGWRPNEDGIAWLVRELWPAVRAALSHATLHLFGVIAPRVDARADADAGLVRHPAPDDSRDAFPADAICVVPLRFGSGVRMRILEAWSRGVPVIATPVAAHGLDARDGHELLLAKDAESLAAAVVRLTREPELRAALIEAGRERLRATHDPAAVASRLVDVYRSVASRPLRASSASTS